MCARYTITKENIILKIGEVEVVINISARFNVAPSQKIPVVMALHDTFQPVEMIWGWKPAWSKQLLINAQSETVLSKPTFKKHIANRCLIPADGFYEWTPDKTPIRFTQPDNGMFCFAGLFYESQVETEYADEPKMEQRVLLLTTTPNKTVSKVHNRMPLIVQPSQYGWWLGKGEMFETVLNFPDKSELNWCPVNRALNKAGTEGSELLRPAIPPKELF